MSCIIHCQHFSTILCSNAGAGASRQPMDLQSLSTFAKYGSETLAGFVSKKLADLAAKAGKPIEEMPLKVMTAPKVANELKQMVHQKIFSIMFNTNCGDFE